MVSMENDVLKVSVTGVKSDGGTVRGYVYSSPRVAGINLEHGQQGYLSLLQQLECGADDWQ